MNRRNTIMITALREMCAGKKITALDYAKRHNTSKLTSRISDLRKIIEKSEEAFIIRDEMEEKGLSYSRYFIDASSRPYARKLLKQLEK